MSFEPRIPAYPVDSVFIDRWSPRSFLPEEIPDAILFTAFEAARWAPSGSNRQPWRFLYAKRGSAAWPVFLELPSEGNRSWALRAAALVLFVSQTHFDRNGEKTPSPSHAFDAGAAWANFAHQAHLLGWHTHAMGGFDKDAARLKLNIPEGFQLHALVAIGKIGPRGALSETLQQRELPSGRMPLDAIMIEGGFDPNMGRPEPA